MTSQGARTETWFDPPPTPLCTAAHVDSEEQYVQAMEKFGDNLVCRDDVEVGSAFLRFAVFTRELTALFKNLVRVGGSEVTWSSVTVCNLD